MELNFDTSLYQLQFTQRALESGYILVYRKTTYPVAEIDPLTCTYDEMLQLYADGNEGLFEIVPI